MNQIVINNIKRIMKEKELTMYGIEMNGGISRQLMSSVLKHGNPTLDTLKRISKDLGVELIIEFKE